jgi:ankyrin repeat protein
MLVQDGMTALHFAAKNGSVQIVQRLLEAGADPSTSSAVSVITLILK